MSEPPKATRARFSRRSTLLTGAVLLAATGIFLTTTAARGQPAPPAPSLGATPGPDPTPMAAPVPAPGPDPTPTPMPSAAAPATAPVAPPAPAAEPPPSGTLITGRAMYATDSVNLRNAPGTEGTTVLLVLAPGQEVAAGATVGGWVLAQVGDVVGWVSATYLEKGSAPADPPPDPAPTDGSAGTWMTALVPQVDPGGLATWIFERNGSWGASDGHNNYIDPNVPADKRLSVMVHEYSHVLQVRVYGSLTASVEAMSAVVGASPTDVTANEEAADCMTLMQGALWVYYGCPDDLRPAAAAVLAGQRP